MYYGSRKLSPPQLHPLLIPAYRPLHTSCKFSQQRPEQSPTINVTLLHLLRLFRTKFLLLQSLAKSPSIKPITDLIQLSASSLSLALILVCGSVLDHSSPRLMTRAGWQVWVIYSINFSYRLENLSLSCLCSLRIRLRQLQTGRQTAPNLPVDGDHRT